MAKKKMSFNVGDIVQARYALTISNTDDTDEESDDSDIFMVIEIDERRERLEYKLIRQKSLKISYWDMNCAQYNFNKV
jgi:hypothetical protein